MKTIHKLGFSAIALVMFSAQACSSEEAAAPSRPPIPPAVVDPGVDGGSPEGGDPDGGPGRDCFDTEKDKPTAPAHFLNQCNSTECFKFDNGARIEGFQAGKPLPPLN